jgi:uncharacterized protein YbcI
MSSSGLVAEPLALFLSPAARCDRPPNRAGRLQPSQATVAPQLVPRTAWPGRVGSGRPPKTTIGPEGDGDVSEISDTALVEHELAAELMRIHEESYGKGAGAARVHYLEDTIICLLDQLELMPNEQFLVGAGHGDGVLDVRGRFQQAIQPTFSAAVERATGRRVISFVSATRLDPHWSVEIFRLAARSAMQEQSG